MATKTWGGETANWTTSGDWSPTGAPQPGETVIVDSGQAQVTSPIDVAAISIGKAGIVNFIDAGTSDVSGAVTNANGLVLDNGSTGGSNLAIAGALTNSAFFSVGSPTLAIADTVTAASLNNTGGSIYLIGSASVQAKLDIKGGAAFGAGAGVLNSVVYLGGDALLEFDNGQITTIDSSGELTLYGEDAFIADSSNFGANSALSGLTENFGLLDLENGAFVTTTGALTNSGAIELSGSSGDKSVLELTEGAINEGSTNIGADTLLSVDGANSYAQTAGATYVYGTIDGAVDVNGGAFVVESTGVINGAIDLQGGALDLDSGSTTGTITFTGPATLVYDATTYTPPGGVSNFSAGDILDLSVIPYVAGDFLVYGGHSGGAQTYILENAISSQPESLTLDGSYAAADFTFAPDILGGTDIGFSPVDAKTDNFTGSATSDILLQNGSGILVDWIVNNGAVTAGANLGAEPGWSVAGSGDFNGDGTSDILLTNGGNVVDWTMQNGVVAGASPVGDSAGYAIVGTGDFIGNGTSDILLQNSAGALVDWIMSNGAVASGNYLGTAAGWSVAGTGDFTGNGVADVLLENSAGTVVDWTMQNGIVSGGAVVGNAGGYAIVGTGDFSGNGTDDILLQNSAGALVDWMMSNGAVTAAHYLGTAAGWTVSAIGDYTGNGVSDILLTNGGNAVDWTMQNGVVSGATLIGATSGFTVKH